MSAPIKLFLHKACPFAHRAFLVAAEKGLIESKQVEIAETSLPTPEWYNKEINPRQTLPGVQLPDGKCLPGSMVIVDYFDEAFPTAGCGQLMPQDPKDRADIRTLINDFDGCISGMYKMLFIKDDDAEGLKKCQEEAIADLEWIEGIFKAKSSTGPFFLGQTYSMADVALVTFIDRFRCTLKEFCNFDLLEHAPRLAAMMAAVESRPAFQATSPGKDYYLSFYKEYRKG